MKLSLIVSTSRQRTISKRLLFEGKSLFSTEKVMMELLPAEVDCGIIFDVNGTEIPALSDFLKTTELHTTTLSKDGVEVLMIEHLMAAIYGLGIDNLQINLKTSVIPAKDASSEAFAHAFTQAGIIEQGSFRKVIKIEETLLFEQPEFEGRKATLNPNNTGLKIRLTAPFPEPIGTYTVEYSEELDNFTKTVAWARTFLRSSLDLEDLTKWNGIRSVYKALPEDPRQSPVITFTDSDFLTPLKQRNEPATHKLLDTIGDLALVGYRIQGSFNIDVPGHKFTHFIAKGLRRLLSIANT